MEKIGYGLIVFMSPILIPIGLFFLFAYILGCLFKPILKPLIKAIDNHY